LNPRFMRNGLLMLVLVMGVGALLYTWLAGSNTQQPVAYGQFLTNVAGGQVKSVSNRATRSPSRIRAARSTR
jgi:hypothetical protein